MPGSCWRSPATRRRGCATSRPSSVGRRNHYTIDPDRRFRYPTEADVPIGMLLDVFTRHDRTRRTHHADLASPLSGGAGG